MKAFLWFVVGGVVGFVVGVVVFRLAADPTDGWADLTSLFGSLFTYGPVGAVSGLALARRKRTMALGQNGDRRFGARRDTGFVP